MGVALHYSVDTLMIAFDEVAFSVPIRRVSKPVELPAISPRLLQWFGWYSRGYLRRHFHGLRLSNFGFPSRSELPIVIYCNHASWWDPLVCLVLKNIFFEERAAYAPIESAMLDRYRFFKRLGFFGVEQNSLRGAARFLKVGEAILQDPKNLLVVTPQGRFVDIRERPLCFKAGLGSLASRSGRALFVPLAIEYTFWNERLPEVLVRFGTPLTAGERSFSPEEWTELLEERLMQTQDFLAEEGQSRNPGLFKSLLEGGAGQGGFYDLWRWAKAQVTGENFRREHGAL